MCTPKDVSAVLSENNEKYVCEKNTNSENIVLASILKIYWLLVTVIYLGLSFTTGAWAITWLIWLIASAIEQAIKLLFSINDKNNINSNINNVKTTEIQEK